MPSPCIRFVLIGLSILSFSQTSSAFLFGALGRNGAPCFGASSEAVSAMREYLMKCGGRLNNSSGNVVINDFSVSPPMMFIMDQSLTRCVASIPVTYGNGSQQTPPEAGNTPKSNMTPAGFHITKPHSGSRYNQSNSVGLSGTGSENNASMYPRGILIHGYPQGYTTEGCIGVPLEQFDFVKEKISYGAVVYNHFARMPNGTSSNNCTAPGTSGARSGGANGTSGKQ